MKWFVVVLLVLAGIGSSIALLARPGVEASPDATITVDSMGDNEDRDGVITLREAIQLATGDLAVGDLDLDELDNVSGSPGPGEADTIVFDPGVFPPEGLEAINLGWTLPPLHTGNDTVDGSSAGVILDGINHWFDCLDINSSGNSVKGLQLHDCNCGVRIHGGAQNNTVGGSTEADRNVMTNSDTGVCISDGGTSGNVVIGNYIGTDPSGSHAIGNGNGVSIWGGAQNNTVGGSTPGERNLISGNTWGGVNISGGGTNDNEVIGNYIGTDATAEQPEGHSIPNGSGVGISDGAQGNVIGGSSEGERNVISGNMWSGVWIGDGGTNYNVVSGNYIGTDASGYNDMGNGSGVDICCGAQHNTIGGSTEGERNLISRNQHAGVSIHESDARWNRVIGNYIGTDASGSGGMGNNGGVSISNGAQSNTIGGSAPGEGNVISANGGDGISIGNAGTDSNVVIGNYIGTDASGSDWLGNERGVWIGDAAQNNIIGGSSPGERNVISANHWEGVQIWGWGADGNVIKGNYIGTDASGAVPLGNNQGGVSIHGGAQDNIIGGSSEGERNVISGNEDGPGVSIRGDGTNSNTVKGNYIGTDVSGTNGMGNRGGMNVGWGARYNTIGGASPGERNIISGNNGDGLLIGGEGANENVVVGNYIGTDASGTAALPNDGGVSINGGAQNNTIGGSSPGEGNVISGNNRGGIGIGDWGTDGNVVVGNLIGTNASGTAALPNNGGVSISEGAQNNTIGGSTPGERNIISGNWDNAIWIGNEGTNGNVVVGNYIGTDLSGAVALPNDGGVNICCGAQNNTIGGSGPGDGNLISGNNWSGVTIGGWDTYGNVVVGNLIGTDLSGTIALPNGDGVNICCGAQNNTVGGSNPGERNVISGNTWSGVWIGHGGTSDNVVQGNYIGTDATASYAIANNNGVSINDAQSNAVGGPGPGEGNIISGNDGDGIFIGGGGANWNTVQGNYIGTDPSGTAALPNDTGINICCGAEENTIGGSTPEERNIISGNGGSGVNIGGGGHNQVAGNYIGTDVSGTSALPNNGGVNIGWGSYDNTIGGNGPGEGNLISGNDWVGIWITDDNTNSNVVQGNYVGTDASGTVGLPNPGGIVVIAGANWNQIGGPAPEERNIISGNDGVGVTLFFEGTHENLVEGNYIGLNAAGDPLGNLHAGVKIFNGADNNTLRDNVISDNGGPGVALEGMLYRLSGSTEGGPIAIDNQLEVLVNGQTVSMATLPGSGSVQAPHFSAMRDDTLEVRASSTDDDCGSIGPVWLAHIGTEHEEQVQLTAGVEDCGPDGLFWSITYVIDVPEDYWDARENAIEGNRIGTNAAGDAAIPNNGPGVELGPGSGGTVVGTSQKSGGGSPNLISGNNGEGVRIQESWGNRIGANHIGTDLSGTFALPNHGHGVHILQGAESNSVFGNVIAGNEGDGVQMEHENTIWNGVMGNHIGVDASGTVALANWGNGVTIAWGASGNSIGGSESGRNVITGNHGWGVRIHTGAENNSVSYNYIGLDAAGMPGLPSRGVVISNGSSYNQVYENVISDNPGSAITVGEMEYALNGSNPGPVPITLDGQLEILVNGETVFLEEAEGGPVWPGFSAVPGDTLEVRASATDGSGSIGPVWLYHLGSFEHIQLTPGAEGDGVFWSTTLALDFPAEGWITENTWIGGNLIGTDPSGETPMPNDGHGVDLRGASQYAWLSNNTIAFNSDHGVFVGSSSGNSIGWNTVHSNSGDGVRVDDSIENSISGNSIHSNTGKGIENINGGNNELPPPVLTGGGSVTGLACPYCWVEIFSDEEDEGAVYEGWAMATADGTFVFPGTPSGPYITATVRDDEGNTSEFSGPIVPVVVRIGSGSAAAGESVTVTLEAINIPDPGLGAFTIDITYDPGVVTPTVYAPGPALDEVLCNGIAADTLRCTGARATAGAVGDLNLVDLTFGVDAGASLGEQSPLTVAVVTLADVDGHHIGTGTQDGTITAGLCGDVDCDGDVDAVDALFILQYVVGLRLPSDQCPAPVGYLYLPAADVNCDSNVDAVDALFVLQYVVGLREELCVCPSP